MPAPPTELVEALRPVLSGEGNKVARHLFFRMEHSQGTVLVWDGIRKMLFGGETYLGVGGLASVKGVSDSGDVQSHQIEVQLNGVALKNVSEVDPDIRDKAALLTAGWIKEGGQLLGSLAVFTGKGDVLRVRVTDKVNSISALLRAPFADWRTSPLAYWTDADQRRHFLNDSGFKFMKSLENATVTGWGIDPESGGTAPKLSGTVVGPDFVGVPIIEDIGEAVIGDDIDGLDYLKIPVPSYTVTGLGGTPYKDTSPGTFQIAAIASDFALKIAGLPCYVDTAGTVRSPAGRTVSLVTDTTRFLRRQTAIVADGTATAEEITAGGDLILFGTGSSGRVYCNKNGQRPKINGSFDLQDAIDLALYKEATTGNAVTFSTGRLRVSGSPCVISTTGVILSAGGKRIVKQAGTAAEFMRVWV
jgi:hypothetical protein